MFLRFRSKEVVSTGRIVLILLGREGPNPVGRRNSFFCELLARSIADLVAQVYIIIYIIYNKLMSQKWIFIYKLCNSFPF